MRVDEGVTLDRIGSSRKEEKRRKEAPDRPGVVAGMWACWRVSLCSCCPFSRPPATPKAHCPAPFSDSTPRRLFRASASSRTRVEVDMARARPSHE